MKWQDIQTNNPLILEDDGIYYRRKVNDFFEAWKRSPDRKPLIVKGLRQSGKTKAILRFGIENYDSVIYIDFRNHPDYAKFFVDYEIDAIKERISAALGISSFIEGRTLIVFDEIQDCPIARGSLKNFCIDGRYDVVCSGSMLGISGYNEDMKQFIPVGYERIVRFEPMDFEEFLWAYGFDRGYTRDFYRAVEEKRQIDPSVHESMIKLFRLYMVVGGMPDIVKAYFAHHDLALVRREQRSLVDSYRDDFGTRLKSDGRSYVKAVENAKINAVLDSMPSQLSREKTTKFTYNLLADSHAKSEKYEGAIEWLVNYGLLRKCENLEKIDIVQAGYAKPNQFKLFFADSGLFCSQLDASIAESIIFDSMDSFKGAIYENIVCDAFGKSGRPLYYFSPNERGEIDFVTNLPGKTALVEVKANKGKTRFSDSVISSTSNPGRYVILKLTAQNIGQFENKVTLPYYLAGFLPKEEDGLSGIELDLPDPKDLIRKPI